MSLPVRSILEGWDDRIVTECLYENPEDDSWYDAKGLQWTQIGPAPTLDPNYVYDTGPHFAEFSGGAVAWVTEHGIYGNDEAVRQFGIKLSAESREDVADVYAHVGRMFGEAKAAQQECELRICDHPEHRFSGFASATGNE